jgi:hypothetical protein
MYVESVKNTPYSVLTLTLTKVNLCNVSIKHINHVYPWAIAFLESCVVAIKKFSLFNI